LHTSSNGHYNAETDSISSSSSSLASISLETKLLLRPDFLTGELGDPSSPRLPYPNAAVPGLTGLEPLELTPDPGEAKGRGHAPDVARDDVRLSTNVKERDKGYVETTGSGEDRVRRSILRLGRV